MMPEATVEVPLGIEWAPASFTGERVRHAAARTARKIADILSLMACEPSRLPRQNKL